MLVFAFLLALSLGRDVIIKTAQGSLKGSTVGRSIAFKGIPFAAPPVGPLRWRGPQPPSTWSGIRDATSFAADCIQWRNVTSMALVTSEDCLYLNLWVPLRPARTAPPIPVMIFFFGGSWAWGTLTRFSLTVFTAQSKGGTQFTVYDGARIIEKTDGVIVCTVNYRLGALGFIASSELSAESGTSGNYGLLDQRAAMQWVQQNIAAFGGDGSRITIWGESAGAGSVSNHLVLPKSWPFFSRAIVESGPIAAWVAKPFPLMQAVYDGMMAQLNCSSLACLRSLSPYKIQMLNNVENEERDVSNVTSFTAVTWAPVIDGVELTDFPIRLATAGKVARVPLLIGSNRNEGTLFTMGLHQSANESTYREWITKQIGPVNAPLAYKMYPSSQYGSPWWSGTYLITDAFFACPSRSVADIMSRLGLPVYLYQFTHVWDEISLDRKLGVFHGSELLAVFAFKDGFYELPDHTVIPILLSPREYSLVDDVVRYWTSFGAHGDPNANGDSKSVRWPRYNSSSMLSIDLDLRVTVATALRKPQCDFWSTVSLYENPS